MASDEKEPGSRPGRDKFRPALQGADARRVQNKRPDAALKGGATLKKGAAVLRPYKARRKRRPAAALKGGALKRAMWRQEVLEMRDFVGC